MFFFHFILATLLISHIINDINCAIPKTFEEAAIDRQNLIKKYIKKLKNGRIKLTGGKNEHEGNVEIFYNGKWGSVCDDEWDANEAIVVCSQLGYTGFRKITHNSVFGLGNQYWMDNVYCDGTEKELGSCRFDGWGHHDCTPMEAAGVICDADQEIISTNEITTFNHKKRPLPNLQVRLAGGKSPYEGRVEISFGGNHWNSICGDGWSLLEANVVCKSLSLGFASSALSTNVFISNLTKIQEIVLSGTECYGNETGLGECLHHYLNSVTCHSINNSVASVTCTAKMADLEFDHKALEQSAHIQDVPMYFLQCAMEENCMASSAYKIKRTNTHWHLITRRLLKFTASALNSGNADFRPSTPKHLWEWHTCHMHYHSMEVFAVFNIFDDNGNKVAEGHKASFCLEDNECLDDVEPKYACADYGDQGISINCSDIYRYTLDCQWIDISDIKPGLYKIQISVNAEFKVPEQSFDNNSAMCMLLYTETYARVYDCVLQRP